MKTLLNQFSTWSKKVSLEYDLVNFYFVENINTLKS